MMKTLVLILLLGLVPVSVHAAPPDDKLPPPPEGKAWALIWHDEFEGSKLDESKWTYRPDGKRKGGWWSMLLSDEIGSWAGDITKAKLPDQFLVDYVRVYDLIVGIYQDGTMAEASIEQLHRLAAALHR